MQIEGCRGEFNALGKTVHSQILELWYVAYFISALHTASKYTI